MPRTRIQPNLNREQPLGKTAAMPQAAAAAQRKSFMHHCNHCSKIPSADCFKKGHVGQCAICNRFFNGFFGCNMNGHRYRDGVNLEVRAKYDEVPAAEIQRRYMAGELDGEETCRNGEEEAAGCKRGRGAAAAEEVDEPSASQTGKEKRRAARMQRLAKCKKR